MKISRKKFDYLTNKSNLKFKMFKIKKDRYIYIFSFKTILKNIYNVGEGIVMLPVSIILAIISTLWECMLELPDYMNELWHRVLDLCPIKYIKVVDDETIDSME